MQPFRNSLNRFTISHLSQLSSRLILLKSSCIYYSYVSTSAVHPTCTLKTIFTYHHQNRRPRYLSQCLQSAKSSYRQPYFKNVSTSIRRLHFPIFSIIARTNLNIRTFFHSAHTVPHTILQHCKWGFLFSESLIV